MFTAETFRFLEDLAAHNNRPWFEENKPRYEAVVRKPALAFIEAVGFALRERVSPHLRATNRSLFRIHRDTRFSKDKTPYKTHVGLYFPHGGAPAGSRSAEKGVREDVHHPGFYLHLEPGNSFAGCGLWHPPNDRLNRIREAIVEDDEAWVAVKEHGLHLGGDTLKRPPAGFPKDHRFVDDLMRKDFITSRAFTEQEICGPNLVERFVEECRRTAPLVRFLCGALELPW